MSLCYARSCISVMSPLVGIQLVIYLLAEKLLVAFWSVKLGPQSYSKLYLQVILIV